MMKKLWLVVVGRLFKKVKMYFKLILHLKAYSVVKNLNVLCTLYLVQLIVEISHPSIIAD